MSIMKKKVEPTIPPIQQKEEILKQEPDMLEQLKQELILQNYPLALWEIKRALDLLNIRIKDLNQILAMANNIDIENDKQN